MMIFFFVCVFQVSVTKVGRSVRQMIAQSQPNVGIYNLEEKCLKAVRPSDRPDSHPMLVMITHKRDSGNGDNRLNPVAHPSFQHPGHLCQGSRNLKVFNEHQVYHILVGSLDLKDSPVCRYLVLSLVKLVFGSRAADLSPRELHQETPAEAHLLVEVVLVL